jgi:hypothetical protein
MNTIEEIINRGLQAKEVLGNETILSFFEELKGLIKDNIVQTLPADWKTRERLYDQHRSVEDLVGIMQSYASAADEEIAKLDADFNNTKDSD